MDLFQDVILFAQLSPPSPYLAAGTTPSIIGVKHQFLHGPLEQQ